MDDVEWTMDELLEQVRSVLPGLVADGQPRYKVTDLPDARTVRYYVSLGLVDQPSGRRGTFALYGRRHLLQLSAVKKLQAEYLPIKKIEAMLAGASDAELEGLLGGPLAVAELTRPAPRAASAPHSFADPSPGTWLRHQLAPGVELDVREGTALAPDEIDALTDQIARILRRQSGS